MATFGLKSFVVLADRGVLIVSGADARGFLQGLISNDINKVGPDRAIYAAFLTPQGKYLHDFFIAQIGDSLMIDCEGARLDDLVRRLGFFRLRAEVSLDDASQRWTVLALLGDGARDSQSLRGQEGRGGPFAGGICFVDARYAGVGARALLPKEGGVEALKSAALRQATAEDYERLRLSYGLPDGSRDLAIEKSLLLENGFEELNGLDWDKGCYVGQELTARTRYRGLVRKCLLPVTVEGPLPESGTRIMLGEREAGEMRSGLDKMGLAMLRLEMVEKAEKEGTPLTAKDAKLTAHRPAWMVSSGEKGSEPSP
ncbi:MAG: folate-binding protein [Alphaproteobacteria bacterium]